MNSRVATISRCLLLGAVATTGTSAPLAAEVITVLAPAPDAPVFSYSPLRDVIVDSLADVVRFRHAYPLSDVQTAAIRAIVLRHREAIIAQARARLAVARMLRATIETPGIAEPAIREAAQMTGAVIADGVVLRHQISTEILQQLTPEQATAWHDVIDRIEDRIVGLLERT